MRHRSLKHLLILAALLGTCAPELAPAATTYPDVGHWLWAAGGTRSIYVRADCQAPPAPCPHGLAPFNPNAASGDGTDGALLANRYGIRPFAGAASPSRGPLEGEEEAAGSRLQHIRALAALPGNPLGLSPGYQPTVQDATDIEYVTLDGVRPAFESLLAWFPLGPASPTPAPATCPPATACPTCPACQPVPAPHSLSSPEQRAEELKALGEQHWAEIKPMVIAALVLYRKLHQAGVI